MIIAGAPVRTRFVRSARRTVMVCAFSLLLSLGIVPAAQAGEFRIIPIMLTFEQDAKSEMITLVNEGKEMITIQARASAWTQDRQGTDVYADTTDIVFFPKICSIEPGGSQVIRVGLKGPRQGAEKLYRLFLLQLPPTQEKQQGTGVRLLLQFGVPIFVKPAVVADARTLEPLQMENRTLRAVVTNNGSMHFRIESVLVRGVGRDGAELFSKKIDGWYLLSGSSRTHQAQIPQDICGRISSIDVTVETDAGRLNGRLAVKKEMCQP